jgi:hypothetical protein
MGMLRRWVPFLAAAVLLTVVGIAASLTSLPLLRVQLGLREPYTGPTPAEPSLPPRTAGEGGPAGPIESIDVPMWLSLLPLVLIVLALGVGVVVILRAVSKEGTRFRSRPLRRPQERRSLEEEVVAAVEAGLLEIDESQGDPRKAVIACWVRLERAAADVGSPRMRGETSTDLVLRLLGDHQLSGPVLTQFAEVYRQARYASHEVDENMRLQARQALSRLHSELTGAVAP